MLSALNRFRALTASLTFTGILAVAGCDSAGNFGLPEPSLPFGNTVQTGKSAAAASEACSDPANAASLIFDALEAVNTERTKQRLRPVRLDPALMQIADFYACRMIEDGFFTHYDPFDGSTVDIRAADFGYAYRKVGENLAAGHRTAAEVVAHWMRSSGHRANLLDPAFVDAGIAVKQGGEYGIYWVIELGRPLGLPPHDASATKPADPPAEPPDASATRPADPPAELDGAPTPSSHPASGNAGDHAADAPRS